MAEPNLPAPRSRVLRWDASVRARVANLRAQEWPKPETASAREKEQAAQVEVAKEVWAAALARHRSLEGLKDDPAKMEGLVLLAAFRHTKFLAVASGLLSPRGNLSNLPHDPPAWAYPIPAQEHPVPLRGGVTLDPRAGDPEAFAESLATSLPFLSPDESTPTSHFVQWVVGDFPDRLLTIWPEPHQIVEFEEEVLERLQGVALRGGRFAALRWLKRDLGMRQDEAEALLAAAVAPIARQGKVDVELERGLALNRVEGLMRRARKGNNLKVELEALKLHALVAGLGRDDPTKENEQTGGDLLEAIQRAHKGKEIEAKNPPKEIELKKADPAAGSK